MSSEVEKYKEQVLAWLWRRHHKWTDTAEHAVPNSAAAAAASYYAAAYYNAASGVAKDEVTVLAPRVNPVTRPDGAYED